MKCLFYMLLLAIVVSSCKSKTEQEETDTTSTVTVDGAETQKLIAEFKPIIQGVWVKKSYIDKVIKMRSPLNAFDEVEGANIMVINADSIKADSLTIGVGWNNHEGSDIVLHFKPGKRANTIKWGTDELGYEIKHGDTILVLYRFSEEKNTTQKSKFIKAANVQPGKDLSYGMDYLINKGIIAGKYSWVKDDNKSQEVVFSTEGKISGLGNFKTFYILNDLNMEPLNNLDEIIFDIYNTNQTSYTFKFDADTLGLYETKPNADSTLLLVDKLKYKLVRKK
nr:hypothetical protein [uncultured Mucilaginibacter sp.]